jgi:hypothetical protein
MSRREHGAREARSHQGGQGRRPVKLYLDHNIVSAFGKGDTPGQTESIEHLWQLDERGEVQLRRSKLHQRELDKYDNASGAAAIQQVLERLSNVEFVEDHELLGFHSQLGPTGGSACPLVSDDPIARELHKIGLDRTDAHHVMLAIRAKCDLFLTCDKRICSKARRIEERFSIRVTTPEAFIYEWSSERQAPAGGTL